MSDARRTRLTAESLEDRSMPAIVITVTSAGDSIARDGTVTLREAILAADSHKAVGDIPALGSGPVTIRFAIPGSGAHVIQPRSELPPIDGGITIDATSQRGYSGSPLIAIDGSYAGSRSEGLVLLGGGNTVMGLRIANFKGNGIVLASNGNRVSADWIGVDASGFLPAGNGWDGIVVVGEGNVIGGTKAGDRVVVSGNHQAGIDLSGSKAIGNQILGDYVGTDVTGFASVANRTTGILIQGGARYNTLGGTTTSSRNVICGNASNQLEITGRGTSYNTVMGNYIGVDSSGESTAQGGGDDVLISGGASNNRIGGSALHQGNLIAGAGLYVYSGKPIGSGIDLTGSGTTGNVVEGNWVGLDTRGVAPLSDLGGGIMNRVAGNIIGGKGIAQNVIADTQNSTGIGTYNHILPVGWYTDSIRYLGNPSLLGGTFRT